MFEVVSGQRQVVFSWSSPPVTQHNELITSYTLSCSPSPSSLPQSPSQSGPLTVAGFSPDTSYSCSVVANNGLGSGPPAHTTFTTLQDCELTTDLDAGFYNIIMMQVEKGSIILSFFVDTPFQIYLVSISTTCSEFVVS